MVGRPLVLGSPQSISFGHGALWVADHGGWLVKIDPKTLAIAERFHVGGNVSAVTYGFGSVWAALQTGQVARITPEHRR